jgi:AcrR family transcriptional regulator
VALDEYFVRHVPSSGAALPRPVIHLRQNSTLNLLFSAAERFAATSGRRTPSLRWRSVPGGESPVVSLQTTEKKSIIEAAYRCLTESAGAAVSITDILAAAGLSTRAFYRHFESKDGLLLAMFRSDSDLVIAELRTASATATSPAEALRRWIDRMLRLTAEESRRRRVLILTSEEAQRARGYAAERARFQAEQEASLAQILRDGRLDGSFPLTDPWPDARSIRAAVGQAFEEQMSSEPPVTADQAAAQVTDFVFRALGATDARPSG